jgi:hypothetical protein
VISRVAGTGAPPLDFTFRSLKAGTNRDTGSVSRSLPSSASMRTATVVTGLVIEAM